VEVRADGEIIVLDAGTGLRPLGLALNEEFGKDPIRLTLLISHTHWDHIQGLPFFTPGYSSHNRIRVIAPHGRGELFERALKNQMDPMHFPVGLDQMQGLTPVEELASDHVYLGNFSIGVIPLNHPGGCAGFRIEANGAAIGYLPDHEPYQSDPGEKAGGNDPRRDALVGFIRDLDLLILDTQYTAAEYKSRIGWGHGCLPQSVALAIDAGVRRLAFFHHDPLHDDPQIDRMVEIARGLAGNNPLLVQGAVENEIISFGATTLRAAGAPLRDIVKIATA
jgi:phosphoribosyl 1,2-cyclic phosphodiesterase